MICIRMRELKLQSIPGWEKEIFNVKKIEPKENKKTKGVVRHL